ncbi:MAG TPA: Bax inhibitor-1 family protein [Gemmatimonadaceae bacterium]|nr:Bax inhibitor-1 family protein [Gemmatimonadaceae bacterium]
MGVSYRAGTLVRSGAERATLVRRTYMLVLASVVMTIGGVAFAFTQEPLMAAVARHPFLSFIAVLAPLFLALNRRKSYPANIALTLLFTLIEGIWLAPILLFYMRLQPGVVGEAAALTLGAFVVLTGYAFVSRRDFSAWRSFLTVGLFVLLGALVLNMFFHNPATQLWLSVVGILIFCGFIIVDTWRIRNVYGPDDYVEAAVSIYLDLLNVFLFILSLLGGGDRS